MTPGNCQKVMNQRKEQDEAVTFIFGVDTYINNVNQ